MSEQTTPAPHQSGAFLILLVENGASVPNPTKTLLEKLGYQVILAGTAMEALNLFQSSPKPFDLAIVDYHMPEMKGNQLVERFRKNHATLPVFLGSQAKELTADQIQKWGINGWLQKPYSIQELDHFIRRIFLRKVSGLTEENAALSQSLLPTAMIEDRTMSLPRQELRKKAVAVMTRALKYWEITTHQTKIELAEKSQLWQVSTDRDTCRTRTLDKYLSLEKLPRNPHFCTIFQTVEYVLSTCQSDCLIPLCIDLEEALVRLKTLFFYLDNCER